MTAIGSDCGGFEVKSMYVQLAGVSQACHVFSTKTYESSCFYLSSLLASMASWLWKP